RDTKRRQGASFEVPMKIRRRRTSRPSSLIPIVDRRRRVVGWTERPPALSAGVMIHPEAEKLLGAPIAAIFVELHSRTQAKRAGAPPNWRQPWKCLALCDSDSISLNRDGETITVS